MPSGRIVGEAGVDPEGDSRSLQRCGWLARERLRRRASGYVAVLAIAFRR